MQAIGEILKAKWIVAIMGVAAILLLLFYTREPAEPEAPPMETVTKSLKSTGQVNSYRYSIKMSTVIDGSQQTTSSIKGERQSADKIHFAGTIYESEVDFYIVGQTTYSKDYMTKEWLKNSDIQLNQKEIFMHEINPLASLSYKELNNVKYLGVEKYQDKNMLAYTAKPVVNNPYMEILWTNFEYKFWLNPDDLLVYKATVAATSKNNPQDKLNLTLEFSDFGETIDIKPPV